MKKRGWGGAAASVAALVCSWAWAQAPSDRRTSFAHFVSVAADRTAPAKGFNAGKGREAAEEASSDFLRELKDRYDPDGTGDFSLLRSVRLAGHVCQVGGQSLENRPILGALARICFLPGGAEADRSAVVCDAECLRRRSLATLAEEGASGRAEEEARKVVGDRFGSVAKREVERVWGEDPNGAGLVEAYRVSFETRLPYGRYVAYVHGATGELLGLEDRIIFATGAGHVYLRDLITTPALTPVTLIGLTNRQRLANGFYAIFNADGPAASSPAGQYVYPPEHTHFDEVQAYYGMQFALAYFLEWGFEPPRQIPIVVHYGEAFANAFYDGQMIALGDGDAEDANVPESQRLRDLAKDNTVVTHEYGHFVVDSLAQLEMNKLFGDSLAIHEGMADYFTCAVYNLPTLGDGVMVKGGPLRRCDTRLDFSQRWSEPHVGGQILSGALWELRGRIGPAASDRLALATLTRVDRSGWFGTTRLHDMYAAALRADEALFRGAHARVIRQVFESRGFEADAF